MSRYGIKLIWKGFPVDRVIGFSPSAYERWRYDIEPGTRMLLYETSRAGGAQAIVSEVEVVAGFAKSAGLGTPTQEHDHPVQVKVIHRKGSVHLIPKTRVQAIIRRPGYPQQNDSWTPLTEAQYREFLKIWGVR